MKNKSRNCSGWLLRVALAGLFLTLGGCAAKAPELPEIPIPLPESVPETEMVVQISASPSINPDGTGRPSPVVVSLYELKSPSRFTSAGFFDLTDKPAAVLEADLLGKYRVGMKPGGTDQVNATLDSQTRHIGVLAGFRDLNQSSWRAVATVQPGQINRFSVVLDAQTMRIESALP